MGSIKDHLVKAAIEHTEDAVTTALQKKFKEHDQKKYNAQAVYDRRKLEYALILQDASRLMKKGFEVCDPYGNIRYFVQADTLKEKRCVRIYDYKHKELGRVQCHKHLISKKMDVSLYVDDGWLCDIDRQGFLSIKYSLPINGWYASYQLLKSGLAIFDKDGTTIARKVYARGEEQKTYIVEYSNEDDALLIMLVYIAYDMISLNRK